jgi:hypothetical protein
MTRVHVTGGVLDVETGNLGGGYPDNTLPTPPPYPDHGLPTPPPGTFPPPIPTHPIVIAPPGTPPGVIWPSPGRPDNTLPTPPMRPDNTLPPGVDNTLPTLPGGAPPVVDNTLPGGGVPTHPIASQTYWMLVYTPGHGWKYVSVDPSLRPDHTLPPHAQPKG